MNQLSTQPSRLYYVFSRYVSWEYKQTVFVIFVVLWNVFVVEREVACTAQSLLLQLVSYKTRGTRIKCWRQQYTGNSNAVLKKPAALRKTFDMFFFILSNVVTNYVGNFCLFCVFSGAKSCGKLTKTKMCWKLHWRPHLGVIHCYVRLTDAARKLTRDLQRFHWIHLPITHILSTVLISATTFWSQFRQISSASFHRCHH